MLARRCMQLFTQELGPLARAQKLCVAAGADKQSTEDGLNKKISKQLTTEDRLSKNLSLIQHVSSSDHPRPLVLLFGWLFAKPAHLRKFSDFYTDLGFDVVSVEILLGQLLRPKKVQSLMRDVLDICHDGHRQHQPVVCHTLSVGGYMYGEILTSIRDHSERYGEFGNRMYGQIFDSVIDFYGIPSGLANAVTQDEKMANRIQTSLEWYLDTFQSTTADYIRASQAFHDNEWKTPSLFIYSDGDRVCHPDHYERLARTWRDSGIPAETLKWSHAPHVSAFKMYPMEYQYHVTDFLKRTGIPGGKMDKHIPYMEDHQKQAKRVSN